MESKSHSPAEEITNDPLQDPDTSFQIEDFDFTA
jgi:hypothetical protein